jgi:hypothetical protein
MLQVNHVFLKHFAFWRLLIDDFDLRLSLGLASRNTVCSRLCSKLFAALLSKSHVEVVDLRVIVRHVRDPLTFSFEP